MDEPRVKKAKTSSGFGLLAVQSVSCAVVVLAVLILRLVSGNLFSELDNYFHEALQQNTLATALHALWEETPFSEQQPDDHV